MGWALSIKIGAIADAHVVEAAPVPLEPGQARIAVRRFALTANNITYAAFGTAMRYWDFFPGDDGGAGCRSGGSARSSRAAPPGWSRANASMAISRRPRSSW